MGHTSFVSLHSLNFLDILNIIMCKLVTLEIRLLPLLELGFFTFFLIGCSISDISKFLKCDFLNPGSLVCVY